MDPDSETHLTTNSLSMLQKLIFLTIVFHI